MINAAESLDSTSLFDIDAFQPLQIDPSVEVGGLFNGTKFSAGVAIGDYAGRIARHYSDVAPAGLPTACSKAAIPFDLPQFGLILTFANPVELNVHDDDMVLEDSVRSLSAQFGPVVFRNARMTSSVRDRFHRNIFPHLRFHVDRGAQMPNQYSCFTRDPSDPEQRAPRDSSTLFVANIVAWLEQARSSGSTVASPAGVRPSYDIFGGVKMAPLLGDIIFEQPWSEPAGTGEICVIDNRSVMHATYHKDGDTAGYPIGARYLF